MRLGGTRAGLPLAFAPRPERQEGVSHVKSPFPRTFQGPEQPLTGLTANATGGGDTLPRASLSSAAGSVCEN